MIAVFYFLAGLVFWFVGLRALVLARWATRLPRMPLNGREREKCSVVIAARDEVAGIEATVRRVLAQEGWK